MWSVEKKKHDLYVSNALMFGSTSSVYGFNRVAKALQHLAISFLSVLANQYFDDYPCIELQQTSLNARQSFEELLLLLGWKCAAGDKAPPFSSKFDALGNTFDLSNLLGTGAFIVKNKDSRVANLQEIIGAAITSRSLRPSLAAELAGKLQFATAQTFGNAAKPALRVIRDRADGVTHRCDIDIQLDFALRFIRDYIVTAPPRLVRVCDDQPAIHVYTDGSSEGTDHLWGAVIVGFDEGPVVAQGEIPRTLSDYWLQHVGDQIICQVELYPVLLVKQVLSTKLAQRRIVFYIDNDPSRDGLISGASDSMCSRSMLYEFSRLQRAAPSYNWFARVPSFSNCADAPSRGMGRELAIQMGSKFFFVDWVLEGSSISALMDPC